MNTIKENQDNWGGRRDGAGRKPGSANIRTREIADKAAEEGLLPLEYMLSVLRNEEASFEERKWAAEKAAPYMHSRMQPRKTYDDDRIINITIRKFTDGEDGDWDREVAAAEAAIALKESLEDDQA